jgi:hypothetical protein
MNMEFEKTSYHRKEKETKWRKSKRRRNERREKGRWKRRIMQSFGEGAT